MVDPHRVGANLAQPTARAQPCCYPFVGGFCFLVASPPVRDLLLCAKHLFVAAMVASGGHKLWPEAVVTQCQGVRVINESRRQ